MKTNKDTFNYVKSAVQTYILGLSIEDQVKMLDANFNKAAEYIAADEVKNSYDELLVAEVDGLVYSYTEFEEYIDVLISLLNDTEIIALWSQIVEGAAQLSDGGRFVTWPAKS